LGVYARFVARVLILVENLSVPFDQRVWHEATSLSRAGYDVTVVCPRGVDRDREAFVRQEGVAIHRFPLAQAQGGAAAYVREYAAAFWHMRRLALRLARERPFEVVHACNPPDFLLLGALALRRRGARFVFDQHDLTPELYCSRFDRSGGLVHRALLHVEHVAFRLADVVLAPNESYRRQAIDRGGKDPASVFLVRNGPSLSTLHRGQRDEALKRGKRYLLAYVGMMGPQDGVEHAVRALAALRRWRDDWQAIFLGAGDALPAARELAAKLGLAGLAEFPGLAGADEVASLLATADVGLAPEPASPLNDVSSFIKVAEYMAMSCPVVCFDLPETRVTAANAAVYAPPNDEVEFARCIDALLSNAELRIPMGAEGRRRVEDHLAWEHSEHNLLTAYERAIYGRSSAPASGRPSGRRSPSMSDAGSEDGSARPIAAAPGTR
jgi:glycosyltransferase involved in cell wall biosynthesis